MQTKLKSEPWKKNMERAHKGLARPDVVRQLSGGPLLKRKEGELPKLTEKSHPDPEGWGRGTQETLLGPRLSMSKNCSRTAGHTNINTAW